MQRFSKTSDLPAPASFVFDWHSRDGAFERLTPPWEPVRVVDRQGSIRDGDRLTMEMGYPPASIRWVAEHRDHRPQQYSFCDVQVSGPFAHWQHTHTMEPNGDNACRLIDDIQYDLPLGALGNAVAGRFSRAKIARMFRYRHAVTSNDIAAHWRYQGVKDMKVLVSGSTGLVGETLLPFLTTGGHQVTRIVRSTSPPGVQWDPAEGTIDAAKLEGYDAVVHLSGENIAGGRWTEEKKKRIRDSRVNGTRLLAENLAKLSNPPKVLVCASAIGYYGDRGDEIMTEDSAAGEGFLSDVCVEWERSADAARAAGIRVVHLRFGVILAEQGGALATMLMPFKLGVGGVVGSGDQYMSWVALDDVVGMIHHAIMNESVEGPVNAVAPNPVTNREYTKTLGKVLGRPTILPIPAFGARLVFGEMGDALLLASTRVVPRNLEAKGYQFRHPELEGALRHILGE